MAAIVGTRMSKQFSHSSRFGLIQTILVDAMYCIRQNYPSSCPRIIITKSKITSTSTTRNNPNVRFRLLF